MLIEPLTICLKWPLSVWIKHSCKWLVYRKKNKKYQTIDNFNGVNFKQWIDKICYRFFSILYIFKYTNSKVTPLIYLPAIDIETVSYDSGTISAVVYVLQS